MDFGAGFVTGKPSHNEHICFGLISVRNMDSSAQARQTCFDFNSVLNQNSADPVPDNKSHATYHTHRAFNIKATLNRNASLSTDLRRINPIRPGSPLPPRPKTSDRAQTALSRHLRRLGTAPKSAKRGKPARKLYREHLSHVPYGRNTLNWDEVPEWELARPQDLIFKNMAHRKVKHIWKQRNMPDHNPVPSYDKLVTKALNIKSPKKRKRVKQSKSVQYLKPGPIFRRVHISSSNASNRNVARKDEQITIDIETRFRTHRPNVVLWPSDFYKQRHLNNRGKKKKHKSPKQNMLINRKNKKQRIEFQNTFTNSYLFQLERDSDFLYIPKQYDVEIAVIEQACSQSKKWRAVFTINSHHFQSGIIPFTITVRQISNNQNTKQHITNMTTDNSYVMLKCNSRHRKLKKKRKRRKHSKRKRRTKRKVTSSRLRATRPTARKMPQQKCHPVTHPSLQQDTVTDHTEHSDVDSLVTDFAKLKCSIIEIQEMLHRAKILGDGNAYHELKKREQQMMYMIKTQILGESDGI